MAAQRKPQAPSPRGTQHVSQRTAERRADDAVVQSDVEVVPPANPVEGPPVEPIFEDDLVIETSGEVDLGVIPVVNTAQPAHIEPVDPLTGDLLDRTTDTPVVTTSTNPEEVAVVVPVVSPVLGYMHPQGSPERPVMVEMPPQDRERPEHAPVDGWLLWPGDPVVFPHMDFGTHITPLINIHRMFYAHNSKRPSFQTMFPAGVAIARSQIDKLNAPLVQAVTETIPAVRRESFHSTV